jgi:hypothetical protein
MPRFLLAFWYALLIGFTYLDAQNLPERSHRELPAPTDIDPNLTEQLRRLEQEFGDAILHRDANTLERVVGPEFTLRISDVPQSSLPRAMWMDNTLHRLKAESFAQRDDAARKLADDLAAVSLVWSTKATIDGRDFSGDFYLVDLWWKNRGTWQIIARYSTPLGKPPDRGSRQPPPATDIDTQLTEQLRQLERELGEAGMRKDAETLDHLVAPEYTLRVGDDPQRSVPREQWLGALRPRSTYEYKIETFDEHHLAARKLPDNLAVTSLVLTQKATFTGRDRSGDFYLVDVWKKHDSKWQIIARYSTPIGKEFDRSPPQGKDAGGSDEHVAGNPHHRIVPLTAGGMQKFLKQGFEVISGNPAEPGVPFVIRIYNTENQVVPPHWHPEDEHVKVIKGIWCVGDGDTFDKSSLREMNVGDYVFVPKQMHHFAWSKTPTVLQIHGIGPFKMNLADPWLLLSDKAGASHFKFKMNDRVRSKRGEGVVVFGAFSEKNKLTQYIVEKKDGDAFAEWEEELEKAQ